MFSLLTAFDVADASSCNTFALVDPAQDPRLPGVLVSEASALACLFEDPEADVRAVAPHLIEINTADRPAAMEWLDRHAPQVPCATLLASPLSLAELARHLAAFLEVTLPDRTQMVLAFWDPMIFAALVGMPEDQTLHVTGPVFSEAQRHEFLAPISGWWYWDRSGHLRHLDSSASPAQPDPAGPAVPLLFNQHQVDLIVEASVPDNILHYIRLNQPGLLSRATDEQQYSFIRAQIGKARSYQIEGTGDLVNYCCLAVALGETFDTSPRIASLLRSVKARELSFDNFMVELPAVLSQPDVPA
ncbi:DUF4123 domain-containing protein [Paraburkholderia haematera]|uniref:DUF4123 domain-containing protein n=1 Tax=Paraburkholderia haematera TaxID=2793077 RepID=A0ABN7N1P6_9BURK|nr:DUF4123 domain-containing protein [Paraburkholderia haematera]CAE6837827.1 hypothetical protein R69888_06854 [Paraburkholderia haematera]